MRHSDRLHQSKSSSKQGTPQGTDPTGIWTEDSEELLAQSLGGQTHKQIRVFRDVSDMRFGVSDLIQGPHTAG